MTILVQRLTPRVSRVTKVAGVDRVGESGLVVAVDVGANCFSIRFDRDKRVVPLCNPDEFEIGGGVPGTIARGEI